MFSFRDLSEIKKHIYTRLSSLITDPVLAEYNRHCSINNYRIIRPLDALGEKKAIAVAILSDGIKYSALMSDKSILESDVDWETRVNTAEAFLLAETIYIEDSVFPLLMQLAEKIEQTYSTLKVIPPPKPLPFEMIYLSSDSGFRLCGRDYGSILFGRSKKGALTMYMHYADTLTLSHVAQWLWDALVIFLEEKIVQVKTEQPTRQFRKQIKNSGLEDRNSISVLSLREVERSNSDSEGTGTKTDREFFNQWIVRGHIRNQWHPSRQQHEIKWIDPYVKGPEGAPFIEKIRHVNR